MKFREATIADIDQLSSVRLSVKENTLSNPAFVTENDYIEFLTQRGKGWLCEMEDRVVGFAIADLQEENIWALFVHPEFEKKGIGKKLHDRMLDWYFAQGKEKAWLSTWPGTRAEEFYRRNGWKEIGITKNKETKFEMIKTVWLSR